jgi:hypothetical protein
MTAETATSTTPEVTTTAGLETPTVGNTQSVATSAVGSPAVGASRTPVIPVTGLDIVLVECQFCVDTLAHALLVLPDTATFEVVSQSTTTTSTTTTVNTNCSTIEVNNGKQVVLCSGPEKTPITLNICTNGTTCTSFPVQLQACPLAPAGTAVPNKTPGTSDTATPPTGASPTVPAAATVTVVATITP